MALFIRDDTVTALAEEVRRLTNARTKTEVVRQALEARLAEIRKSIPLTERLARSKAMADAIGPRDPSFDMKRHSDEMWGEV